VSETITQERMENAMTFLAESDDGYAIAKTDVLRCEILAKRARSRVFTGESGSVEARKALAEAHPDVILADDALCQATLDYERLKAKRSRAEIVIDVWRSLNASQRKS
jgi:hypothetical protein